VIQPGVCSSGQEKRLRIMTMKALLNRMINILICPRDEWLLIKDEPASYAKLLLKYVAPLAAVPVGIMNFSEYFLESFLF
jgi:hypothetical protein